MQRHSAYKLPVSVVHIWYDFIEMEFYRLENDRRANQRKNRCDWLIMLIVGLYTQSLEAIMQRHMWYFWSLR